MQENTKMNQVEEKIQEMVSKKHLSTKYILTNYYYEGIMVQDQYVDIIKNCLLIFA